MKNVTAGNLFKLFEHVKKGSKEFKDDSVKQHLDTLIDYATKCKVVTEFGIHTACATLAFLISDCKKVYSYNLFVSANAAKVKQAALHDGVFFKIILKDNLAAKIKTTDLLFIDTDHWYGRTKAELTQHQTRVRKWILMNNTETFGVSNPFDGRPGMKPAIFEFLDEHPEWDLKDHFETGHGLTILERKNTHRRHFWQRKNTHHSAN
ncbi:MAG: hypothetical protein WCQ95_08075 [Bacteroidota bacterium]